MVLLSGCSAARYVSDTSINYNAVIENVSNNDIVANILRGRDRIPLYFTDLSQIRGSYTVGAAAQAGFPLGPLRASTTRDNVQLGTVSIQENPSFDFAPLNTKQFTQGMLEQLSLNEVQHYISRDIEMILQLAVGQIDQLTIQKQKDGSTKIIQITSLPDDQVQTKVQHWSSCTGIECRQPRVNVVSDSTEVSPTIPESSFQNPSFLYTIQQAAAAGLKVEHNGNQYRLAKSSSRTILCVASDANPMQYMALGVAVGSVVNGASLQLPQDDSDCTRTSTGSTKSPTAKQPAITRVVTVVHFRSPEAIFYYLGKLVNDLHNPLRFYVQPATEFDQRAAANADPSCAASTKPQMDIMYRGTRYFVGQESKCDQTTNILIILSDLLNLHRDANEIPTTKTVTVQ